MDDKQREPNIASPLVDEDCAEAFVHSRRPHRVLGLKLRPFCRWHAAQLDWVESPFAGHRENLCDIAALYIAARICQTQFPNRFHRAPIDQVGIRICGWFYRARFAAELGKFSGYMRDYGGAPEYIITDDGESRKASTPWYLFQVASLAHGRIEHRAAAWNLPLGEGNWWCAAFAEASGVKIDLITPEDRAQLRELEIDY